MPRPNAHQDFAKQQDLLQSPTSGKKRGELAELAFLHKAVSLGFPVSKTYGDSDRFDFANWSDDQYPHQQQRDFEFLAVQYRRGFNG